MVGRSRPFILQAATIINIRQMSASLLLGIVSLAQEASLVASALCWIPISILRSITK
jgi:hypothetical protein